MSGFTALAEENARYDIPRTDYNFTVWFAGSNGPGDNNRGNDSPQWKADYFAASMTADDFAESLDIAMYKLCFIDTQGTASEAFQYTVNTMADLETAYPGTVFVWWTMPVMTGGSARRDDYSSDGGHLNSFGAERIAKALWVLFAGIAGWNG